MSAGGHEHGHLRYVTPGLEPAVFAARADVVFAAPAPPDAVRAQVEAFLRDLGEGLVAAGCTLVGHVKGTLDGAERGGLSFSATALQQDGRTTATLTDTLREAVLTINVIVFGIPETALCEVVTRAWEACVPAATIWTPPPLSSHAVDGHALPRAAPRTSYRRRSSP